MQGAKSGCAPPLAGYTAGGDLHPAPKERARRIAAAAEECQSRAVSAERRAKPAPFVRDRTGERHLLAAWPVQLLIMAIAVALAYGHTLDVPFYLDDFSSIRENPLVYHWQGFAALRDYAPMRWLTYASFALNHYWGGFQPAGYHGVNIAIHLLAGIAVWGLVRGLLRTPRMEGTARARGGAGVPLLAALVFLLHPLQTGAVTYIVQRLASLAALFYLIALAAYVQARLATSRRERVLWAAACALSSVLGLFSKENTATLPAAFLLVELLFFAAGRRDLARLLAIAGGGAITVWLVTAFSFGAHPLSLATMADVASHSREISRDTYLATQLPVLWTYIRLFLWPVGLHLDYAVDLRHFADGVVLGALAGHLALMIVAFVLAPRRPLIGFGILFFYLAHSVESGIIPIPELAFEHRNYLPLLGLGLAAVDLLWGSWQGSLAMRGALALTVLIPIVLGGTTWRRNEQWRHPVTFWEDNVRLAPSRARAWGILGKSYLLAQRPEDALRAIQEALRLQPHGEVADINRLYDRANLAEALRQLGRIDEGLAVIEAERSRDMPAAARAAMELGRGNLLLEQGSLPEAESAYREALESQAWNLPAMVNLASALAQQGRLASADSLYEEVLRLDPGDAAARQNLLLVKAARWTERGDALQAAGQRAQADSAYRAALEVLEQVLRVSPDDPLVRDNAARIRARIRVE